MVKIQETKRGVSCTNPSDLSVSPEELGGEAEILRPMRGAELEGGVRKLGYKRETRREGGLPSKEDAYDPSEKS